MHVLLLGKVPPIQGGVARETWLACRDIAAAGHSLDVLTNANAMPIGFRQMFLPRDDVSLVSGEESMHLQNIDEVPPQSYIPWAPPYFSQLMSYCLESVEKNRPDVIVGWYLEPYGMVASVIGQMFGVPVVLRHAGSDIGRMRNLGGLKGFYDWALSQAAQVITGRNQDAIEILRSAGVSETAIVRCRGRRLCDSFSQRHEDFDLRTVLEHSVDWFSRYRLDPETLNALNEWNQSSLDCDGPVIGTYGKIAEVKGTYHLLDALEQLAERGDAFCYRGIWSATPYRLQHALRYLHQKPSLKGRVTILPPVAPWRIPAFIRSCSTVAFLENRFPIEFHGPQVPREVLACKRPLLLSREIFNKVYFKDQLAEEVNVMVIEDPQEVSAMADQISRLLNSSELLSCLGHHAGALSRILEAKAFRSDPIVDVIEDMGGYERRTHAFG
ncbi:MAG: hypothetical protein JJ902_08450 [Roseibium sp.]|nr:hypothetical protein [Roseibium sp.]